MPNAKIAQLPTPWSLEPNARRNFVDANGRYIGCCFVDAASALVVEAVNARNGNAAALREALVAFVDSIQWLCDGDEHGIFKRQFAPLLSDARAALAAPARNCDVGTAEEQIKRFETFCNRSFDCGVLHGNCGACPLWTSGTMGHDCEIKWSQLPFAPAEGGAK